MLAASGPACCGRCRPSTKITGRIPLLRWWLWDRRERPRPAGCWPRSGWRLPRSGFAPGIASPDHAIPVCPAPLGGQPTPAGKTGSPASRQAARTGPQRSLPVRQRQEIQEMLRRLNSGCPHPGPAARLAPGSGSGKPVNSRRGLQAHGSPSYLEDGIRRVDPRVPPPAWVLGSRLAAAQPGRQTEQEQSCNCRSGRLGNGCDGEVVDQESWRGAPEFDLQFYFIKRGSGRIVG